MDNALERVRDRERIGSSLYQAIVHSIVDAALALQGSLHLIGDPKAAERVQEAIDLLDDVVKEVRSVVLDLDAPGG
jgi:signal transduction histidine kinase